MDSDKPNHKNNSAGDVKIFIERLSPHFLPKIFNHSASFIWGTVNTLARPLFSGSETTLSLPIISVGNLQSGGTGKTPVVIEILKLLKELGARPGVLSRGYRSRLEKSGGLLYGKYSTDNETAFGDESLLIHENTKCPVFIGRHRADVYLDHLEKIPEAERPTVLVLDDGFQQMKLKKDLEVVCLTDATSGDAVFRDFFHELRTEHFLLRTKSPFCRENIPGLERRPDGEVQLAPSFKDLNFSESQEYVLVTGIADGSALEAALLQAGAKIHKWYAFPDHHNYNRLEIEQIEHESASRIILTTEKDWVKIHKLTRKRTAYHMIPLLLAWKSGKSALIERICKLLHVSS